MATSARHTTHTSQQAWSHKSKSLPPNPRILFFRSVIPSILISSKPQDLDIGIKVYTPTWGVTRGLDILATLFLNPF